MDPGNKGGSGLMLIGDPLLTVLDYLAVQVCFLDWYNRVHHELICQA